MRNSIKVKLFETLFVLLGVIIVIFLLFNVLPADPARMMLDKREDTEQLNEIRKKYALDQPVYKQFLYYINDLSIFSVHENLDEEHYTYINKSKYSFLKILSYKSKTIVLKKPYLRESYFKKGERVSSIIKKTFPNTIVLATTSILIASLLGIVLGVICSIFINTFLDRSIIFFTAIGISLPSFFSAILFAWFFGFLLHDYTGLSVSGSLFEIDDYTGEKRMTLNNLVLPALTLSLRPLSIITQLTRNSILDILSMDYIRTATSKGLSKIKVLFKHALVNALNPVITSISGWFASLLAGSVFVEFIFGWNGIGKELVNSLNNLDVPVVMGIVLLVSIIFIFVNIAVDYIYSIIDPRIKTK